MKGLSKNIFSLLFVTFVSTGSFAQSNGFEELKALELMDLIFEQLETNYVDEIKPGEMNKTAIDAMLKELDPYTVYYHEANIEDYRLMTTGQYGGVGATIQKQDEYSYFTEPFEGSPSQKSGVKAGDKIVSIEGNDMKGKTSEDVTTFLKGPKGTSIDVVVERNGEKQTLKITRDEIKFPDVPYFGMLTENVGYISLNSFTQTASQEVITAFTDLKSKGMKQLIFDLRGNGGGLLIEAVHIVNMFVKKGQTVVTTRGRIPEENKTYATQRPPTDLEIPVIVLVDKGSASASEIVSGSLQDLDRAVIVGQTSYGKGLVQRTYDLKYGSKIKLTISKYYTPSGRCVQRLEYYDREGAEKPKEIADSLLKTFTTPNGRKVIDGRGIEPDVEVSLPTLSSLLAGLVVSNIVFNYATDYARTHDKIGDAKTFKLTEEEYQAFATYAKSKEFKYTNNSLEELKKVKEKAEKEGYWEDIKNDYEEMLLILTPSKERDLEKFKVEINEYLSNEIVSRYYYQKGRREQAFQYDDEVKKALEIFNDMKQYNTILGK